MLNQKFFPNFAQKYNHFINNKICSGSHLSIFYFKTTRYNFCFLFTKISYRLKMIYKILMKKFSVKKSRKSNNCSTRNKYFSSNKNNFSSKNILKKFILMFFPSIFSIASNFKCKNSNLIYIQNSNSIKLSKNYF